MRRPCWLAHWLLAFPIRMSGCRQWSGLLLPGYWSAVWGSALRLASVSSASGALALRKILTFYALNLRFGVLYALTGTYSYAILVSSLEVFRIFSDKGTGGGPCVDVWMVTLSWPNLRKSSRYFWREFYVYNDEGRTSIAAEAVVLFCFFLCTGDFGGNYRADQENIE